MDMDKKSIYNELNDRIYDYIQSQEIYPQCDGTYNEKFDVDFDLGEYGANCKLYVSGYCEHEDGDYYTPSSDSGKIECECDELTLYDEDGMEILNERNVHELDITIYF